MYGNDWRYASNIQNTSHFRRWPKQNHPPHFILTHKRDFYLRLGMIASPEGYVADCLELEVDRDDVYIATLRNL
jgi:hypothetical protein